MEPWATGGEYLNFADRPGDASTGFDPDTYARLREIRPRSTRTGCSWRRTRSSEAAERKRRAAP